MYTVLKKRLLFLFMVIVVFSVFMAIPLTIQAAELSDKDIISDNIIDKLRRPDTIPTEPVQTGDRITRHPADSAIGIGGSTSFSVGTSGIVLGYQWQYYAPVKPTEITGWFDVTDGGIYSGANTATLTLTNVPNSYYGYQYQCVVTMTDTKAPTKTLYSNPATLKVGDAPPPSGIQRPELSSAPEISGQTEISLNAGYSALSTSAYTLTGNPAPEVSVSSTAPQITWNSNTKKIDIAAGLKAGVYQIHLKAGNTAGSITFTVTVTVTATGTAPEISGQTEITLEAGYEATSSGEYKISGDPAPTVTKVSGDSKITWNDKTKKLDIAAGLDIGKYPVELKVSNIVAERNYNYTVVVTESTKVYAVPKVFGETSYILKVGYSAKSTEAYTISGTSPITVTKTSGDSKITWNDTTKKFDIAAGLPIGEYPVVLKLENSIGITNFTVTFKVEYVVSLIPTITGNSTFTLTFGYSAASTEAYTIGGTSPITVTKISGDSKITWNNTTKKFDIATGLPIGTYPVKLKASNAGGSATFTLTVNVVPLTLSISGQSSIKLSLGYLETSTEPYTLVGAAPITVTKVSGTSKIKWDSTANKLNIAAGLDIGEYSVMLRIKNSEGEILYTIVVSVVADSGIIGESEITLGAGYSATSSQVYTITGKPIPGVIKKSGDSKITWNDTTKKLDIAAGLPIGDYLVVLRAKNSESTFDFDVMVRVTAKPFIVGETEYDLTVGNTVGLLTPYELTGTPVPSVEIFNGDERIKWNANEKTLDITEELELGTYIVELNGRSSAGDVRLDVYINVNPAKPVITGDTEYTLYYSYTVGTLGTYKITGDPAPTVTVQSEGGKVRWNPHTKTLDVVEALDGGTHKVELKASNSAGETKLDIKIEVFMELNMPPHQYTLAEEFQTIYTAQETYESGQFMDVDENAWFGFSQTKVIANAYKYGLMKGKDLVTFDPDGTMIIAEAVTIAARLHSLFYNGTSTDSSMVPGIDDTRWYDGYVNYAVENGIISESSFSDYERPITRAEMLFIFSRALPAKAFPEQNTVNSLPDVNSNTPYHDEIFMMYKVGIVAGNDAAGTFEPKKNITRAEAAAIIIRIILPETRFSGKTFG